jgi:large subunit ribosomal protein L21
MYAIFKSGGKQYKVAENDVVKLEKLAGNKGDVISLSNVLALGTEKGLTVGAPFVEGAVISAEVLEQKRDEKVLIFKKKRRQNYRRKKGHRQEITVVRILDVSGKGEKKTPAKKEKVEKVEKVEKSTATEAKTAEKKAPAKKASTAKEPKAEKITKASATTAPAKKASKKEE